MKTNFFLTSLCIVLFTITANSQITKGNWMVGGDGNYSNRTIFLQDGSKSKYSYTTIRPDIGYFIIDKFAIGSQLSFSNSTTNSGSLNDYGLGIFTRYYFLKPEKIYNIFTQAYYTYGINKTNLKTFKHFYGLKLGSVIFFTNSVGLELSLGYEKGIYNYELSESNTTKTSELKGSIGFHIYLEKK